MEISDDRKRFIDPLIGYVQSKLKSGQQIRLNFICTHNSRRSQLAQVWAHVAAYLYNLPISSFSGGIEVTSVHENASKSLERFGFMLEEKGENNPEVFVHFAPDEQPLTTFSKLFDDETNPKNGFAAVMTCSDADQNCPFIPGAEARIPLNYVDPKTFDNTSEQENKYDERSTQIASELLYAFSQIKKGQ